MRPESTRCILLFSQNLSLASSSRSLPYSLSRILSRSGRTHLHANVHGGLGGSGEEKSHRQRSNRQGVGKV